MKIILASCDDWQGLYKEDGSLVTQGHSVSLEELCEFLGIEVDYKEVNDDWAADVGCFPDRIEEIPEKFIK